MNKSVNVAIEELAEVLANFDLSKAEFLEIYEETKKRIEIAQLYLLRCVRT